MKAIRSNRNISPHGGIVPVIKLIRDCEIPKLIRSILGERIAQSKYGFDDIFISWILTSFCGGERLEHITSIKKKLSIIPDLNVPSHDTLGRCMKMLSKPTETYESIDSKNKKITCTDYNHNIPLNRLLVQATKKIGALQEGRKYTLDIDQTYIYTECRGAKRNYTKEGNPDFSKLGFCPMVSLIGDLPVYISVRNGSAGARFQLVDCLKYTLDLLDEANISIGRVRSDAAGYSEKAFEMLTKRGIIFNVRFQYRKNLKALKELGNSASWRRTEIKTANHVWDCEVADIPYEMRKWEPGIQENNTYRLVVLRVPTNESLQKYENEAEARRIRWVKNHMKKLSQKKMLKEFGKAYEDRNWKEINGYSYKFYITNDWDSTSEYIVTEYNKRGDCERKFSFLKKDFAWRLPPFMNMNENTVFFIAAALANNLLRGTIKAFHKYLPELRLNSRLRDFIVKFINVACEYIGNSEFVFFNTDLAYEKLMP